MQAPSDRAGSIGAAGARRELRLQATFGYVLLGALLWITRIAYPDAPAGTDLDLSWGQALGWSLSHHLQFGVDTVFTFGPLGYFFSSPYDADLFWTKLFVFEGVFKLALTFVLIRACARLSGPLDKAFFFIALLLPSPGWDAYYFVAILAIAAQMVMRARRSLVADGIGWALMCPIALMKFTHFTLVAACAVVLSADLWRHGGRALALKSLALFLAILSSMWCCCGQALWNLPVWVWRSLVMASGYNEAMSLYGPQREVWLALALMALTLLAVGLHVLAGPRASGRLALGLVLAAATYLTFKAGFVNHGDSVVTFFTFTAVGTFFLFPSGDSAAQAEVRRPPVRRERAVRQGLTLARHACLLLSLYAYGLPVQRGPNTIQDFVTHWLARFSFNLRTLASLDEFKAQREGMAASLRAEFDLSEVREKVGADPVDLFVSSQGVVFVNRLEWRPRPVFQSYAAYSEELCKANARFYESDRAPPWVLFSFGTIDNRLPNLDDSAALRVLTRDYRPVLVEKGFLLLHRERRAESAGVHEGRSEPPRRIDHEATIAFGEEHALPEIAGRSHLLRLDIRYTMYGRVMKFLYKAPVVRMDVQISNGERGTFRILPDLMRQGVLADPYLDSQDRWVKWFDGRPAARIASLRVRIEGQRSAYFEPRIGLQLLAADDVAPGPGDQGALQREYSMFNTLPADVVTAFPSYRGYVDRDEVLVVHAPSEVRYDLEPGVYVLRGGFGIMPDAWLQKLTDGAGFNVSLRDTQGREAPMFKRFLDPVRNEKDRGTHPLKLTIDVSTHTYVVLRTTVGKKNDGNGDWAYWTGLEIKKTEAGDRPR